MIASNRLWSIWDMLRAYGEIFSRLTTLLYQIEIFTKGDDKNDLVTESDRVIIEHCVTVATNVSDELQMPSVFAKAERMWHALKGNTYNKAELNHDAEDLNSRLEDELKHLMFKPVLPRYSKYYSDKPLFGQKVFDKFPAAIDDVQGAGNCLALGEGTACVMHLMRVMEAGLKALAAGLKIPYAPSWESYLSQIQKKIDAKHKTKGVSWRRDEKFYRDVSGDLLTIKQAWRNPTMHIDRRYSQEEAEQIYLAVKPLLERLADKLK